MEIHIFESKVNLNLMYSWLISPRSCHKCDNPYSLRWSSLIYFQCMCWLLIPAEIFTQSHCFAFSLSLDYNFLFIFTLSDLLCINIQSLVWTENENSEQSSRRLWRCRQPSAPCSVTAGQAEEVGQLLIETGSGWPIADGPRASQCGY